MNGVFAAVATPLRPDGRLDEATFERLTGFLLDAGAAGVCLGGATSEYPNVDVAQRKSAITAASRLLRGRGLLVGIGAPSVRDTLDLGRAAASAGARALLLPMPAFFRYEQDDLHAYCTEIVRTLKTTVLLYDLPEFTNPLEPATAISLMRDEPFIAGIKDSSGCRENIQTFAAARADREWLLFVGHDRLLGDGLRAGWNGTISGIAGFCPELPIAIYRSVLQPDGRAAVLERLLAEAVAELGALPAPWGIRLGLQARGFDTGPLPLPLSARRRDQVDAFRDWVSGWLERVAASIAGDGRKDSRGIA